MIKKIILFFFFVIPIYLESNEQLTSTNYINYCKLCLKYVSIALEEAEDRVNGVEIVGTEGTFFYITYGLLALIDNYSTIDPALISTNETANAAFKILVYGGLLSMGFYTISSAIYKMFFRNMRLKPLEPKTSEIKEYNAILASLKDLQKRSDNISSLVRQGMLENSNYPRTLEFYYPGMSQAAENANNAYVFYRKQHELEYGKIIIHLKSLKKRLKEMITYLSSQYNSAK